MQPTAIHTTKREPKLHTSYELPHRIHQAQVYPIIGPNGSNVIVYGHSQGLRVLWRGGRRRHEPVVSRSESQNHGPLQTDLVALENDHELPQTDDERQDEEEEFDPDCPYLKIIQDIDVKTPTGVLSVAVPCLHSSVLTPDILKRAAMVAIASADGAVRLLQIPLKPPSDERKQDMVNDIYQTQIELCPKGPIPVDLSVKFLPLSNNDGVTQEHFQDGITGRLLIAAVTRVLTTWSLFVTREALSVHENYGSAEYSRAILQSPAIRVSFDPHPRSAQILLVDASGAARIYDPTASGGGMAKVEAGDFRRSASESTGLGKWIMTFHTSFHCDDDPHASSALVRRKHILDAKWILNGKGILALLEDGNWGIWNTTATTIAGKGKGVEDFVIAGFLTNTTSTEAAEVVKTKKASSRLAPMTPNTRKSKTVELFANPSRVSGVAPRGGISVSLISPRFGQLDECVVVWYDSEIYSINSMQQFWQRSTSDSGSFGSLREPGISHISDVDLFHENIVSISQFLSRSSTAGLGQMHTQRDLFISTDHHAIILQSPQKAAPVRDLFQLATRPASTDLPMIDETVDQGLHMIDAVLENMSATTRKVGFAQ